MVLPFTVIRKIQNGQKDFGYRSKTEIEVLLCIDDEHIIAKMYELLRTLETGRMGYKSANYS